MLIEVSAHASVQASCFLLSSASKCLRVRNSPVSFELQNVFLHARPRWRPRPCLRPPSWVSQCLKCRRILQSRSLELTVLAVSMRRDLKSLQSECTAITPTPSAVFGSSRSLRRFWTSLVHLLQPLCCVYWSFFVFSGVGVP